MEKFIRVTSQMIIPIVPVRKAYEHQTKVYFNRTENQLWKNKLLSIQIPAENLNRRIRFMGK